jgi:hypothetical protein
MVYVDETGHVDAVEAVDDRAEITSLRKWEKGNGYSFPAFNVPPLIKVDMKKEEQVQIVEELRRLFKNPENIAKDTVLSLFRKIHEECLELWPKKANRITNCLQEKSKQLLTIISPIPEEFKAIEQLVCRISKIDSADFAKEIESWFLEEMIDSPNRAGDFIDNFFLTTRNNPPNISFALEVADWSKFHYPVHHEKCRKWINNRLWQNEEKQHEKAEKAKEDAFGNSLVGSDGKFPKRNLPILGPVILRAMSTEAPCQKRYGRGNEETFPVGIQSRRALAASIEWIAEPERQGITWQNISGVCEYGSGILFAYPAELKEQPPEIASLFSGSQNKGKSPRFEDAAKTVIKALLGLIEEHPNTQLRVFVLVKADKARTKVLVSRRHKAKRVITTAREWQKGCYNIPSIFFSPGKPKEKKWITPMCPFPSELVGCLNLAWFQNGARSSETHGLNIGDGLSLLLDSRIKNYSLVRKSLHLAITNGASLLLSLGHSNHRRDEGFKLQGKQKIKAAQMLPSILGLLLFKLNILKGEYMNEAPFLVGRMLSLADILHKEYCKQVRDGHIPPKLIGNSLMPIAADNPEAGLARLRERLLVYKGWAETLSEENSGLAKWTLAKMGDIAQKLGKTELPDSTTDTDQAQILLGYLASWKEPRNSEKAEQ